MVTMPHSDRYISFLCSLRQTRKRSWRGIPLECCSAPDADQICRQISGFHLRLHFLVPSRMFPLISRNSRNYHQGLHTAVVAYKAFSWLICLLSSSAHKIVQNENSTFPLTHQVFSILRCGGSDLAVSCCWSPALDRAPLLHLSLVNLKSLA
jgi:hypothetical protein